MSEPLYACQIDGCAEEVSYPKNMLRLLNDQPICEECYSHDFSIQIPKTFDDDGDPDEMVPWHELPQFVPEAERRIADLEAKLAEARELIAYSFDYITGNNARDVAQTDKWADKAADYLEDLAGNNAATASSGNDGEKD